MAASVLQSAFIDITPRELVPPTATGLPRSPRTLISTCHEHIISTTVSSLRLHPFPMLDDCSDVFNLATQGGSFIPSALKGYLRCHSPAPGRKATGTGPVPAPFDVCLALVLSDPGVSRRRRRQGHGTQNLQHSKRESKAYRASGAAHISFG